MLTEQKLRELIDKVQENLLTSNNIINRTDYPYFIVNPYRFL